MGGRSMGDPNGHRLRFQRQLRLAGQRGGVRDVRVPVQRPVGRARDRPKPGDFLLQRREWGVSRPRHVRQLLVARSRSRLREGPRVRDGVARRSGAPALAGSSPLAPCLVLAAKRSSSSSPFTAPLQPLRFYTATFPRLLGGRWPLSFNLN